MEFTKEKHDTLLDWLSMNLIKTQTINYNIDTATIRKAFMHRISIYVDNMTVRQCYFRNSNNEIKLFLFHFFFLM